MRISAMKSKSFLVQVVVCVGLVSLVIFVVIVALMWISYICVVRTRKLDELINKEGLMQEENCRGGWKWEVRREGEWCEGDEKLLGMGEETEEENGRENYLLGAQFC